MAVSDGTGPGTWLACGCTPSAVGLWAIEEAAWWSCESLQEGILASVCRTDRFSFGVDVGVRDRVRILDWQQDAYSVEGRVLT